MYRIGLPDIPNRTESPGHFIPRQEQKPLLLVETAVGLCVYDFVYQETAAKSFKLMLFMFNTYFYFLWTLLSEINLMDGW